MIRKTWYNARVKRLSKILCVILPFVAAVVLFTACSPRGRTAFITPNYFNTVSFVAAYASENELNAAAEEIGAEFAKIDNAIGLSLNSDIAKFNDNDYDGAPLEISEITYNLLNEAKRLYEYTGGAYNPAVGRLVDLWGFSPRLNSGEDASPALPYDRDAKDDKGRPVQTVPDEKYVTAFKSLTDFREVETSEKGGKYYVTKPSSGATVDGVTYYMEIDLGGIAKGYAADVAANILESRGITQSYVSVGSSSLSLLESKNDGWEVSLRHPRDNSASYATVYAENTAVSTSGDYERYFVQGGKRYCHIIDASTGNPIDNGMTTVSVFGRSAAEDDALSTALCVMGKDAAIDFINANLTDCRVSFVWQNDSTGSFEFITNMESGYELADFELHSSAKDGKITYVA